MLECTARSYRPCWKIDVIKSKVFTPEQVQFILDNYKGTSEKDLWNMVNEQFDTEFTLNQVKGFKSRNRLKNGLNGQFEKGHKTFNKGMKQEEYMSAEAIERTRETQFAKGHVPDNKQPIGYERITRDGYTDIKVRDDKGVHSTSNFELKHRWLWEKHYGEIPPNHVVTFKNGNKQDMRIDNLMMIDRGTSALLNKLDLRSEYPELTEAGARLIQLRLKASEIERELD